MQATLSPRTQDTRYRILLPCGDATQNALLVPKDGGAASLFAHMRAFWPQPPDLHLEGEGAPSLCQYTSASPNVSSDRIYSRPKTLAPLSCSYTAAAQQRSGGRYCTQNHSDGPKSTPHERSDGSMAVWQYFKCEQKCRKKNPKIPKKQSLLNTVAPRPATLTCEQPCCHR